MKSNITAMLLVTLLTAACRNKEDYLLKVYQGGIDEVGVETGYVNSKGDTIIPLGKYGYCYTDTVRNFAVVTDKKGRIIGIDRRENELFEVYQFDNGPDYTVEGLFRIKKGDKIGYANEHGKVVIAPEYTCAFPFANGKAKVAYACATIPEGEHTHWESQAWIYIDKQGNQVE